MYKAWLFFIASLITVLTLGPFPAEPALIASASIDGAGTIFAIDQDATSTCGAPVVGPCQLPDTDPTVGVLVTGSFISGDLSVLVSVQTVDVATVPGTVNRLDSTGTQVTNTGLVSRAFAVAVGATDFLGPSTSATTTGAGQWSHLGGGFGDSEISMLWFNDPANEQGGIDPLAVQPGDLIDTFSHTPTAANPNSFSHTGGPFAVSDPDLFSMTLQFEGILGPGVRLTGREMTEIKPLVAIPAATPFTLLADLVRWLRA